MIKPVIIYTAERIFFAQKDEENLRIQEYKILKRYKKTTLNHEIKNFMDAEDIVKLRISQCLLHI